MKIKGWIGLMHGIRGEVSGKVQGVFFEKTLKLKRICSGLLAGFGIPKQAQWNFFLLVRILL